MLLGALCGLVTLARLDGLFFSGLMGLALLVVHRDRGWRPRALNLCAFAAGVGAILVPWYAYSDAALGALFPVSGRLKAIMYSAGAEQRLASFPRAALALFDFWSPVNCRLPWQPWSRNPGAPLPGGMVPLEAIWLNIAGAVVLLGLTLRYRIWRAWGPAARTLLLFAPLLTLAQKVYFHLGTLNHYYTAPLSVAGLLAGATALSLATARRAALRNLLVAAALLLGLALLRGDPRIPTMTSPTPAGYLHMIEAGEWLARHPARDGRVGGFNVGLIGYFSGGRVVNLDGRVNSPVYLRSVVQARRADALPAYMARRRILYLADRCPDLNRFRQRAGAGKMGPKPLTFTLVWEAEGGAAWPAAVYRVGGL
jgi:hypothetical protein